MIIMFSNNLSLALETSIAKGFSSNLFKLQFSESRKKFLLPSPSWLGVSRGWLFIGVTVTFQLS